MRTSPLTVTLKLWTSRTITDTTGFSKNGVRRWVMSSRSCVVVRPAAVTSLASGSEILPSGLTGTVRVSSRSL
jgi:hypothetical protein